MLAYPCGVPEVCLACELQRCTGVTGVTGVTGAMMISRVPPPALSDLHPAVRLAGPARPLIGVEERGTAGAAARGRRPAPHEASAPPGLGRSGYLGFRPCTDVADGLDAVLPYHAWLASNDETIRTQLTATTSTPSRTP